MIKINRNEIPADLNEKQQQWTWDLMSLIAEFGSYEKIPKDRKDPVINKYNLKSVKKQLKKMTNGKCSFCESYIEHVAFPHIEHFYPKSKHPKYAFKWSNFLLSCPKCNIPKDDYDTKINAFINPTIEDPEIYLSYCELKIIPHPTSPDLTKSKNTIKYCDLKRTSFYRLRSPLRIQFNELEDDFEKVIEDYKSLTQHKAKLKRVSKLLNSLENLKEMCSWRSQFAGYVRHMVRESDIVQEALSIVNTNKTSLGLAKSLKIIEN